MKSFWHFCSIHKCMSVHVYVAGEVDSVFVVCCAVGGFPWIPVWWSQPLELPLVAGHHLLIPSSSPPPPDLQMRQKIPYQTEQGKQRERNYICFVCISAWKNLIKEYYCIKWAKPSSCCICRVPEESISVDSGTRMTAVPTSQTLKIEELDSSPSTPSTLFPDSPSHSTGHPNSPAESSSCNLSPQLKVCMSVCIWPYFSL